MARTRRVESERLRVPPPLINAGSPSGRGAMEQPNVTSDGDAALTPRFWLAVVLTGRGDGAVRGPPDGRALLGRAPGLRLPRRGATRPRSAASSELRRVHRPARRRGRRRRRRGTSLRRSPAGRAVRDRRRDLDAVTASSRLRRSFGTSVISEVVIGMGASIGREAAPKLMGGPSGSGLAAWLGLTPRPAPAAGGLRRGRRAGGGLQRPPRRGPLHRRGPHRQLRAARWSCPRWPARCIATATAWITLPSGATYPTSRDYHFGGSLMVWARPRPGLVIGALAVGLRPADRLGVPPPSVGDEALLSVTLARLRRGGGRSGSGTPSSSATARTWPTRRSSAGARPGSSSPSSP